METWRMKQIKKPFCNLKTKFTANNTEGGAPVAILEAQATGLPVISSYHADIPEVVVDGKSALLAPERVWGRWESILSILLSIRMCGERWGKLDGSMWSRSMM